MEKMCYRYGSVVRMDLLVLEDYLPLHPKALNIGITVLDTRALGGNACSDENSREKEYHSSFHQ